MCYGASSISLKRPVKLCFQKKMHILDTAEEDELASVLSSQLGAEQYPTVNNSNYLNHYLSLLQP